MLKNDVNNVVADYSKNRAEGEPPTFEQEGVSFWRLPKLFGIDDGIDSLLEHLLLPKEQVFIIGDRDT